MNVAVIFAGGVGKRMNSGALPKQFLQLQGKPIIIHTLEVFQRCAGVDLICIACLENYIEYTKELCKKFCIDKVRWIVPGGVSSQESIFNGLQAVYNDCPEETIVMIHDGVRPNITTDLIENNISAVERYGCAITCSMATETPAEINDNGEIINISERRKAVIAKAPQSFLLGDIYKAHIKAHNMQLEEFIDSASLMHHFGYNLYMVESPWENIKITNPADFYIFKAILEARENSQIFGL